jgi:hypothetical protein
VFEDTLNMSQVSDSKQLYTYGLAYIEKVSQIPITFDVDSIDIFSTKEGQLDWNKLDISNFINIDVPELGYNYYPIRLVGYNHNPIQNTLSMTFSNTDKIESDILYLKDIFRLTTKVSNEVEVKKYDYESYTYDRDKVVFTDSTISNDIQLGNNYINRRGFIGSEIGRQSGSKIQVYNDKICITTDNWRTYHTLLSGNGLFLQNDDSQTIIHKDYGFSINLWNPALQDYRNAIYLGLDSSSKPALFIDNGHIQLNTIIDNVERYRIEITPEKGFYIQANTGTQVSQIWEDRITLSTDGFVIAELLRTAPGDQNFMQLNEQWLSYYNGGLEKMIIGIWNVAEVGEDYLPYIKLGAGDGTTGNYFEMRKDLNYLNMLYPTSNGRTNGIGFFNSGFLGHTNGAISIDSDGDVEIIADDDLIIDVSGTLYINGESGVTDTITVDGWDLTFENGILVDVS